MAPTSRPEGQLNLNLSGIPPAIESPPVPSNKSPFGNPKSSSALNSLAGARVGAGSPLHEQASRLFPKRTRELQSANGLSSNIWGPPTSGTSTPLFEIPESPNQDGFPDLIPLTETGINSPARRGRAGTLPSRISPAGAINGVNNSQNTSKTSRPTPSTSPFRPGSTSAAENAFNSAGSNTNSGLGSASLLSRLRAGSLPQRSSILGQPNLFGNPTFGSSWSSRTRAATLTSIHSSEDPASPQPKDGMTDNGVRTLDYLGLAETPQQARIEPSRTPSDEAMQDQISRAPDALSSFNLRGSNRFRSFSVNTQPKYGDGSDSNGFPVFPTGTLTPSAQAAFEAEYEAVQEKVRLHNQAVQAFAVNASAARPRARTAGLVETPQRSLRNLVHGNGQDPSPSSLNMGGPHDDLNGDFAEALKGLSLTDAGLPPLENYEDNDMHVSRSLWIGSIPNSTTMSSLDAIFNHYGPIESTRVLTHKNCGFVNFENIEHAVRARQILNGKEIFPGAGPVRIGFAKAPTASASVTPNDNAMTPAPDQHQGYPSDGPGANSNMAEQNLASQISAPPMIDRLMDLQQDILQIVLDFGAQQHEIPQISTSIQNAANYRQFEREIPTISEPSPSRVYDAPRLRDIRKRIDNGTCGLQEIEQIALDMLPEIAELSSDYLGNTVVQKLFEFCSEQIKEQMLMQIAPHLAEIGVHKNGTWAAQKIIDVCKTQSQISLIVEHLRPYTVPLFLDQYGNYVLQCCLRFGSPYNDFIFETMLSQIGDVSQGRFGARAMRACLESHHATKQQQRLLAAAIALQSVQLATNANGALLLTWLLDTCTFPRRRMVLAPLLMSHLVHLCTHKVAYLTVLKVINQRNEPDARDVILRALFFSPGDSVLEQILKDQASGVTLIFKILTTPFLDDNMRPEVVRNISKVLTKIRAQGSQGYKRLMDEVGMSSRPAQTGSQQYSHAQPNIDRSRPVTQPALVSQPPTFQRQYSGSYMPAINTTAMDNGASPVRTGSADSFGYPPYSMNTFGGQPSYPNMSYPPMTPQSQYQGFGGLPRANSGTYMNNGFGYAPHNSVNNFHMQNQAASPIPYAAQMSPVMSTGNGMMSQNYAQSNMYGYPQQQQNYYYSPQMQPVHAARGRRVSLD